VLFNANDEAQTVSVPARTTAVFMEQNVFTYYCRWWMAAGASLAPYSFQQA